MTRPGPESSSARTTRAPGPRVSSSTGVVVLATLGTGLFAFAYAWLFTGPPDGIGEVLTLGLVAVLGNIGPRNLVRGGTSFNVASMVLLAAAALGGPAAAGLVGVVVAVTNWRKLPLPARFFNTGLYLILGTSAGYAHALVAADGVDLDSSQGLGRAAVALLVADLVMCLLNAGCLAAVIRASEGTPVLTTVRALLRQMGPSYLALGLVALVLVVLWRPAGLGPPAVVLAAPGLWAARWATTQFGDQARTRERTVAALVAALDSRAPGTAARRLRVGRWSEALAERLGYSPAVATDIRIAGTLATLPDLVLPGHPRTAVVDNLAELPFATLAVRTIGRGDGTLAADPPAGQVLRVAEGIVRHLERGDDVRTTLAGLDAELGFGSDPALRPAVEHVLRRAELIDFLGSRRAGGDGP